MLTEEYIINVYCLVDEMLKKVIKNSIRQRGSAPNLSDAEVIAMEIVGESLGIDQDKKIHSYFKNHWLHYFPRLGHRTTFLRQSANLWRYKQKIREELVAILLPAGIIDGFQMPISHHCWDFQQKHHLYVAQHNHKEGAIPRPPKRLRRYLFFEFFEILHFIFFSLLLFLQRTCIIILVVQQTFAVLLTATGANVYNARDE